MAGRYVVLGLAPARARWFTEVVRWSTSGAAPIEFVKCLTRDEVLARLASGRPYSALLVDGHQAGLDRDLVDAGRQKGCPTLVVGPTGTDPALLGVALVLPTELDRAELVDALAAHASAISAADTLPGDLGPVATTPWRGRLIVVTGPGGTGASTVAMATAQALADDPRDAGMVALADLALSADLAMLHDARDVVPGVQELVEAHHRGQPGPGEVRAMTFDITQRRYRLLLGLRRHRDWTVLRPRATEAAIDGLLGAFHLVVADVEADFEGDDETGSTDVEERNVLARTALSQADAIVVVGAPGMKGLFSLVRTVAEIHEHGVEPGRVLAAVNRFSRQARARAELQRAFAELAPGLSAAAPLFLPERRGLEHAQRDGARLPDALAMPMANAVRALLRRLAPAAAGPEPVPVPVGSLGTWSGQAAGPP